MVCHEEGIAYQADQSQLVAYDAAYYDKCAGYEGQEIGERINKCRIEMVARHYTGHVCDVGIGSGAFIKGRPRTHGYDVNPVAIEWLKRNDLWASRLHEFGALTFWDVIEHIPDPDKYLRHVGLQCFVFASIPVFEDLARIRASKHYRPGEHLYYFKRQGFIDWMQAHGFLLLEWNDHESVAGRESINSFAFKRNRWA
jgi:hypothetical protein